MSPAPTKTGGATTVTATVSTPEIPPLFVTVTVTNNGGISGVDTVAVTVVAPPVLVGAGDIADCTRNQDSLTANLMRSEERRAGKEGRARWCGCQCEISVT